MCPCGHKFIVGHAQDDESRSCECGRPTLRNIIHPARPLTSRFWVLGYFFDERVTLVCSRRIKLFHANIRVLAKQSHSVDCHSFAERRVVEFQCHWNAFVPARFFVPAFPVLSLAVLPTVGDQTAFLASVKFFENLLAESAFQCRNTRHHGGRYKHQGRLKRHARFFMSTCPVFLLTIRSAIKDETALLASVKLCTRLFTKGTLRGLDLSRRRSHHSKTTRWLNGAKICVQNISTSLIYKMPRWKKCSNLFRVQIHLGNEKYTVCSSGNSLGSAADLSRQLAQV